MNIGSDDPAINSTTCARADCSHRYDQHAEDDQACSVADCQCSSFTLTPAIVHRSVMHARIAGAECTYHSCLREKAFADAWERVNAIEHVLAALSTTIARPDEPGAWRPLFSGLRDEWRKRSWASSDDVDKDGRAILYTQRDATVAATVIQWLGTNVGFSFLTETLAQAGYRIERVPTEAERSASTAEAEAKAFSDVRREIEAKR